MKGVWTINTDIHTYTYILQSSMKYALYNSTMYTP